MKRGVTLLEVLISILVASVGLLGAIAIFPLALAKARAGRTADVTAVAGESAMADILVRGIHKRENWLMWNQASSSAMAVPETFRRNNSPIFGHVICIDPMHFAHNATDDPGNSAVWGHFPAVPQSSSSVRGTRLTLRSGNPASPLEMMSEIHASHVFRTADELIYDRPDDNSLPAAQLFTPVGDGTGKTVPGRRQEEGRTTWFATLSPQRPFISDYEYADLDGDGDADVIYDWYATRTECTLSVVVCRDRADGEALHVPAPTGTTHPWNEWTAKIRAADWHSAGIGGGEVTITTNDPAVDATFNDEKYLQLKRGQWVALLRTVPTRSTIQIQHLAWYRVSDSDDTKLTGNRWSQDATLVGPDWPADLIGNDGVPEECDVVIIPNVAHVYERTVQIVP